MKSLDKTLLVLSLFSDENPQWRLQELSDAADLPLSTMHRIVSVLRRHGLLALDPTSRSYRLGYAALDLGRRASANLPIAHYAEPSLRRLARETGETILLTVVTEKRDMAVCIDRKVSRHDLRLHLELGEQLYLHAGASSKVLFAYFPESEVDRVCQATGMPGLAPGTITDLDALKRDLAKIRETGVAFSREETVEGAWGIAVPIMDGAGHAVAGLGIGAPTSRHSVESENKYVALAKAGAQDVRSALGIL